MSLSLATQNCLKDELLEHILSMCISLGSNSDLFISASKNPAAVMVQFLKPLQTPFSAQNFPTTVITVLHSNSYNCNVKEIRVVLPERPAFAKA